MQVSGKMAGKKPCILSGQEMARYDQAELDAKLDSKLFLVHDLSVFDLAKSPYLCAPPLAVE
jgi:hypothetical protein